MQAIKTNRTNSKYAQYTLETEHFYSPLLILHWTKIGKDMKTVENFHIYNISRQGLQNNETYIDLIISICDTSIHTITKTLTILHLTQSLTVNVKTVPSRLWPKSHRGSGIYTVSIQLPPKIFL
jgi:hypothetical protein